MKFRPLPSFEYLHDRFEYNEETGILKWKEAPLDFFKTQRACSKFNSQFAGKEAGRAVVKGRNVYIVVGLDGLYYLEHRIIWKMLYNEEPEEIDHDDGDGLNNRPWNLKHGSRQDNQKNRRMNINNTSGCTGVRFNPITGLWQAAINIDGKWTHLGSYPTKDEAIKVRFAKEHELGYSLRHGKES